MKNGCLLINDVKDEKVYWISWLELWGQSLLYQSSLKAERDIKVLMKFVNGIYAAEYKLKTNITCQNMDKTITIENETYKNESEFDPH